jgi:alkanesulfonate monooxygenase SsuD/methylene tetrahydromethanopterin reductase-like flavin-dependent oxidoreductase (luciferase family)
VEYGYALSSEEHGPNELVQNARKAEEHGFEFALISDHFHPWTDAQGNSPFVWSVIGGIAQATERLRLGTGVTCPTIRIHPAIVAHAAATAGAMMGDRFFLGVGAGENLNEHVLGDHLRLSHPPRQALRGRDRAAVHAARRARPHRRRRREAEGSLARGAPRRRVREHLAGPGARRALRTRRRAGEAEVRGHRLLLAPSEDEGAEIVHRIWPNAALGGDLGYELTLPRHWREELRPRL